MLPSLLVSFLASSFPAAHLTIEHQDPFFEALAATQESKNCLLVKLVPYFVDRLKRYEAFIGILLVPLEGRRAV